MPLKLAVVGEGTASLAISVWERCVAVLIARGAAEAGEWDPEVT